LQATRKCENDTQLATDDFRLVLIVSPDGREQLFRGKVTKPLHLLKKFYGAMENVLESQLLFVYKGRLLNEDDTPETLAMLPSSVAINKVDAFFLEQVDWFSTTLSINV
jgi:hypothetical protein